MHRCPACGNKLTFGFMFRIQKWAPANACPSCGQLLTHTGMLVNGGVAGGLGVLTYQLLKLYVTSRTALLLALLGSFLLGYKEYRSLKVIPTDKVAEHEIQSTIELTPTAAKFTAYLGILGGLLLFFGCIFIVVVLSINSSTSLWEKALFSALSLLGAGGFIVGIRVLRGKSLLSSYPLRKS